MNVVALKKKKITVGGLIDEMSELRDERRKLAARDKELSAEIEALEKTLIELMDNEGVTKSSGHKSTASITEETQFNISDWDRFTAWMKKKNYFHLIQRRISAPSAREIFEKNGEVPGLEPYTKRSISLRNL